MGVRRRKEDSRLDQGIFEVRHLFTIYNHAAVFYEQQPCRHGPHAVRQAGAVLGALTPAQQREAPEAAAGATESRQQQGVEVHRLHQQPGEIAHHAVMTEHDRRLTGCLHVKKEKKKKKDKGGIKERDELINGTSKEKRTGRENKRQSAAKTAPARSENTTPNAVLH